MITAKGVGFLIAAITVFWLGRLTQVGWLYLIDAVLWGLILLSAILPWVGATFLDARRKVEYEGTSEGADGPAEGDQVDIRLRLINKGFWPRFFISASYECPLAEPEQSTPRFFLGKLPASNHSPMLSTVVAHRRGMYSLGRVTVESSAPFGLFRRRVRLDRERSVLVYPQIYPLKRLSLVDGLAGEAMRPRKSRVGMEIAGSRPYFPGDPRRHIHWRNTARAGRPMVKEFEDPQDQTLCLLFDATQTWGEGKENTLEYAIKVMASVADYGRRNRVSARIWGGSLQGDATGAAAGMASTATQSSTYRGASWPDVLRKLALVSTGEGVSLTESLGQAPMGSSALVVVAANDLESLRAIKQSAAGFYQLAVVALEDFGEPGWGSDPLEELERSWIPVTRCRPGQLTETFMMLEQSGRAYYAKTLTPSTSSGQAQAPLPQGEE